TRASTKRHPHQDTASHPNWVSGLAGAIHLTTNSPASTHWFLGAVPPRTPGFCQVRGSQTRSRSCCDTADTPGLMIMASRLRDEGGEAIGGTPLVARHDVPVDGQRDGDAGVPEPLADGPDRSRSGRVACA